MDVNRGTCSGMHHSDRTSSHANLCYLLCPFLPTKVCLLSDLDDHACKRRLNNLRIADTTSAGSGQVPCPEYKARVDTVHSKLNTERQHSATLR
jgi:hypothetical protein